MKTAKAYMNEVIAACTGEGLTDEEFDLLMQDNSNEAHLYRMFIYKVKEAQKNAIETCAELCQSEYNKESILSLIDELK